MCEQYYHGVVRCALGWACWKTYLGRPEADRVRAGAMNLLGNGLSVARHDEEALSVREAELSMERRLGDSESNILVMQGNLANTYHLLGRLEEALRLRRDVYSATLRLFGEHERTFIAANNYASTLANARRYKEARSLLRKTIPVARRVLGESRELTLRMRDIYATALHLNTDATLDDLREAVTTLEDVAPIARRVLGGAHPVTVEIEESLQNAQAALSAALRARERPPARADAIDAR